MARIRDEAIPVANLIAPHTISISEAPNSSPQESSSMHKPGPPTAAVEVTAAAVFNAAVPTALVFKFWFEATVLVA